MDSQLRETILDVLSSNRIMTIATNRPDGWPQATIVGYINDGFLLYCFVAHNSQKLANIGRDPRVSIAIGPDCQAPRQIKALSLAASTSRVTDQGEFSYVAELRLKRYPELSPEASPAQNGSRMPDIAARPSPADVVLLRMTPEVLSVLDYSRGFGHSDLVAFSSYDLNVHLNVARHRWDGPSPA